MRRLFTSLVIFACVPSVGCNSAPSPVADRASSLTGSARIRAVVPQNASLRRIVPEDVAQIFAEIEWGGTGTGAVEMFETAQNSYEIVVLNLPVGVPCALSVEAFDAQGNQIYSGEVSDLVLLDNELLNVTVNLTAADSGMDAGLGPRVETVFRPLEPIPKGMVIDLRFVLTDPDDSELAYALSSSGDGSFDAPNGTVVLSNGSGVLAVRYTTPTQAGPAEVTLILTDAAGLVAEFSFFVTLVDAPDTTMPGAVHVLSNFPPTVRAVHARHMPADGVIELLADATDDGGVSGLTYAWGWDGNRYAVGNPISHPAGVGTIGWTLTVTDAQGAATTLRFDLDTSPTALEKLPLGNLPPMIDGAFMSRREASFGEIVTCLVYATDPDADELGAEWETNHGSISSTGVEATDQGYIFRAEWGAAVDAGIAQVTIAVSDDDSSTVTYIFEINQSMGRVNIHADARTQQEAFINSSIDLDGSGSESDDGTIERYLWEQISGPSSTIVSPESESTETLLTSVGTYVYRLTVWNVNNSDSVTVEVLVIDPTQFSYADAAIDDTGVIYFLDTTTDRVRRYDTIAETFLPSFSTGQGLYRFAAAPEGDAVYVGYQGGRMDVIDAVTGEMSFFAAGPSTILRMAVVGDYIFTIDASGAWETHSLYSRATGTRTFADDWRNISNGVAYAPSIARLFTFRDGTSPNDIIRTDVNQNDGTLGADIDSPYHGDYSFIHPMRLFPDETRIAVASGVFFDTSDLTYAGSIGMGYKDLRFLGNRAYVIKAIGGNTELTEMDLIFNILGSTTYSGAPRNLFVSGESLFLATQVAGRIEIQKVVSPPE